MPIYLILKKAHRLLMLSICLSLLFACSADKFADPQSLLDEGRKDLPALAKKIRQSPLYIRITPTLIEEVGVNGAPGIGMLYGDKNLPPNPSHPVAVYVKLPISKSAATAIKMPAEVMCDTSHFDSSSLNGGGSGLVILLQQCILVSNPA